MNVPHAGAPKGRVRVRAKPREIWDFEGFASDLHPNSRAGRSGMREPVARKQHAFVPKGEGLKATLKKSHAAAKIGA